MPAPMVTPDFGLPVEAGEYESLAADSREAVHVIETCIRSHHVVAVDYVDEAGVRETLRVRPAFIRRNLAGHVVLWEMPPDADEWRELRLDPMRGARDTGEEFRLVWD